MSTALLAALLIAADVESGPKAGDKVPPLKVFGVVGPVEGKEVDYAAERKDAATVYLFVSADKFTRPTARFLKELDGKLGDAGGVAVWVGGDAEKNKEYMPRLNTSLKFEKTALAVSEATGGPLEWGINPDAHLTAVVAAGGKVVKSFAFQSVNETDVTKVTDELKKATKK